MSFGNFPQSINHNIPTTSIDYTTNIIKSPELNTTNGRIADTLLIDSRDRNYTLYPNPNSYKIQLNKLYRDVIAIKLTKGMIPHSGFYISEQNNTLYFSEGSNNFIFSALMFFNNKKYGLVKMRKRGRLKRRIFRRLVNSNRVLD